MDEPRRYLRICECGRNDYMTPSQKVCDVCEKKGEHRVYTVATSAIEEIGREFIGLVLREGESVRNAEVFLDEEDLVCVHITFSDRKAIRLCKSGDSECLIVATTSKSNKDKYLPIIEDQLNRVDVSFEYV